MADLELRVQDLELGARVDVGGRDNEGLRAALTVADVVLIPLTPSSFDVWALDRMVGLVREAKSVNPNCGLSPRSMPPTRKAMTTTRP